MVRVIARAWAAVAVSALGMTGVSAAGAASQAPQPARASSFTASHPLASADARLWVRRYNNSASSSTERYDHPAQVAVSPGGARVFVTGVSTGSKIGERGEDYATVAYRAATGAKLWVRRYNGPADRMDAARAVAVSPDGRRVFVTGLSTAIASSTDYTTIAYDAATGTRLWIKRYNGTANAADDATSLAVSPDGTKIFVTGQSVGLVSRFGDEPDDYATVAYNAATGTRLWVSRYNGPDKANDAASSVAVSPAGDTVYVTGNSDGATAPDYATVAYNAATGARKWVSRYNGPANGIDLAAAVAAGPGGHGVYVTGLSEASNHDTDYLTVAYSAATGGRLWVKRYDGPAHATDRAAALAVGPSGQSLYVTGFSEAPATGWDYLTITYRTSTGARLWMKRYNGPGNSSDMAESLAVGPGGGTVYVTGDSPGVRSSDDYATVAYSTATGTRRWVQRYNGPANSSDGAVSVAVGPGGSPVYVTGSSIGPNSGWDYATIAYRG
jgi:WD40 repeat protein